MTCRQDSQAILPKSSAADPAKHVKYNLGMVLGVDDFVQEFTYHRPVVVGETLHVEGKLTDKYSKQSGERTMTFLVMETVFSDDAGEPVVTERFNLIHRS